MYSVVNLTARSIDATAPTAIESRSCGSCASAGRSLCLPRRRADCRPAPNALSKNSSEVSDACRPILSSLRPRRKPAALGLHHEQRDALGAGVAGPRHHDHEIGGLAVGDEGLLAADDVAIALLLRRGPHAPAGRSRRRARSWRWRRPARRWPCAAASAASAPRCRSPGCSGRRCRCARCRRWLPQAPLSRSSSTAASQAKLAPRPPYASGMLAHSAQLAEPARPTVDVLLSAPFFGCGARSLAKNLRNCRGTFQFFCHPREIPHRVPQPQMIRPPPQTITCPLM